MDESRAARAAALPAQRRSPWLVPGILLLVLVFLTINVLADGPLVGLDQRIRKAVLAQANSPTWHWVGGGSHAPAQLLIQLGNNQVAIPALALCALIAAVWSRSIRPLLAAVAGLVLLLATVIPAKILIARAGPGLPPVARGAMGVFPSGHAATSSVCLGLGVLLLVPGLASWARRAAVAVIAALCCLVGGALIWCDDHWFTDVVAGWATAALIVMAALRISGLGRNSGSRRSAVLTGPAAAVATKQIPIHRQQRGKPDD
jgi:membrane-associated phospholipid phosphatase